MAFRTLQVNRPQWEASFGWSKHGGCVAGFEAPEGPPSLKPKLACAQDQLAGKLDATFPQLSMAQ